MKEHQEYSLSAKVFQQLRDDILKGTYQEMEELREMTLAKELGVSRTPVREALRQLELEGLVTSIPNKGTYVTGITEKDIADIYRIRSRLEGLCAAMAAEHMSEELLNELEETVILSEFHVQRAQSGQLVQLDGRFHEILYAGSGSRMLEHILSDFHRYVQAARTRSIMVKNRAAESILEHRHILEAIRAKDASLAEQLANEHIRHVMDNLEKRSKEYGKN